MNFRKLGTLVLALTIPAIVTSRLAVAQLLYVADDSNQLLAYDAAAGTFTPIGPMPVLIGGMGCADPTSALLYGTDLGSNVGIYSIDSNTATITLLTNVTGHTAVGSTVGPDGNVWAIVTTPTGLLYEVDPFTPTVTDIGQTGFSNEGQPSFDADGNLYTFMVGTSSDVLYQLDPGTAAPTAIGNVGFRVYSAAFCNGTLYAFTGPPSPRAIIAIDPSTGMGTQIDIYGPPVNGSIEATACCTP